MTRSQPLFPRLNNLRLGCNRRFFSACLASIWLCLTTSACSLFYRTPQLSESDFKEATVEETLQYSQTLAAQSRELKTLRSSWQVVAEKGLHSEAFQQIVVFSHPGELRIELFITGINKLGALITVSDEELHALIPDQQVLYIGPPTSKHLGELLNIPLEPEDVMYWISGRFNPSLEEETVLVGGSSGEILVKGKDREGRCVKQLLAQSRLSGEKKVFLPSLKSLELADCKSREVLFRADYHYNSLETTASLTPPDKSPPGKLPPESGCPFPLPKQIKFWLPKESIEGQLTPTRLTCNKDLARVRDQLFRPTIPEGIRIVEWMD